jgi:dipeptidase E
MKKRILAIGGGGFLMEDALSPIDDYILALTEKPNPKICFIPTPAGDRELFLAKFYAAFGQRQCRPSHLSFFSPVRPGSLKITELADQDAIFVSGGHTRAALAVWREFGVDQALRKASEGGVVLSGMSAGALCWFEAGHSSFEDGEYGFVNGLGLLPGTCAVHFDGDSSRRPALLNALQSGEIDHSLALDDHAAALFEDGNLKHAVSWKSGSAGYRLQRNGDIVEESQIAPVVSLRADGPDRGKPLLDFIQPL